MAKQEINADHIYKFSAFFTGSGKAYGRHLYDWVEGQKDANGNEIKPNKVIHDTPGTGQYNAHLLGKTGLGIIPLHASGKVKFSSIDVDLHGHDYSKYHNAIDKYNFPIVAFSSKRGGLHLHTFYPDWVDADKAKSFSLELASILGLKNLIRHEQNRKIEIFPKSVKAKVGNWINLPYYNVQDTKTPALYKGKKLSFADALDLMGSKVISEDNMQSFLDGLPLSDADPSLQTILILDGLAKDHNRNNFLFNAGVYCKLKYGENFESELSNINNLLDEPLPDNELEGTIKSIKDNNYGYINLKEHPFSYYRDRERAINRKFGIGKSDGALSSLIFVKFIRYNSKEPYYKLHVKLRDDESIKVMMFGSSNDFKTPDRFISMCFDMLDFDPVITKKDWKILTNKWLSMVEDIEIDPESDFSNMAMIGPRIAHYLLDRSMAEDKLQMLKVGLVYRHKAKDDSIHYCFTKESLSDFINNDKILAGVKLTDIDHALREAGLGTKPFRIDKKVCKVNYIPEENAFELRAYNDDGLTYKANLDKIVIDENDNKSDDEISQILTEALNDTTNDKFEEQPF